MSTVRWGFTLVAILFGQERIPWPDEASLKENQKAVRDLFKEDYARKAPADQKALAQKLYAKAQESKDDPKSQSAFLVEARDVAIGCADVETAVRAVEDIARTFAVEGPGLKLAALNRIASSTKDPEAARTCARALLSLVQEAIRADGFEIATGAAAKAEALAKLSQEPAILKRATELKAEVESLKTESARVKPLIEKPGAGDAEAIGRYQCFVRGDWDAGLPNLLAGSKPPLRTVAEKDVLKPVDADKQLEVAEGWIEIGQKEKSAWRRTRILARARYWLEQAQTSATGIAKMKIEKRLAETEDAEPGAVNLLRLIDPKLDAVEGEWTLENGALASPSLPWARVQIPYAPPEEYEISLTIERKQGDNALGIGLVRGTTFAMLIDAYPGGGGKSGLDTLDTMTLDKNPLSVSGLFLKNNVPITVVVSVRKSGVTASVDSKVIFNWQGDYKRLTPSPVFKPRDPKMLVVGAFDSRVLFTKIILTPISGQGKKLR
jgi:hypothetical protein